MKWYYKAAEQGHAAAQYDLGVCFYHGKGKKRITLSLSNGSLKPLNRSMLWRS